MKKSEYIKLSSVELRKQINKIKKELNTLEDCYLEVQNREHKEKYETIKVQGCKGCSLESYNYASDCACEHCDGYHYEEKLRRNN